MKRARAIAVAIATTASVAYGAPPTSPRLTQPHFGPRQPMPPDVLAPSAAGRDPAAPADTTGLRARFGVPKAESLVRSGSTESLLRAIARAASIGSAEGVALVADCVGNSDPRVRIAAARGLARHVDQARARDALFLMVTSDPPRLRGPEREDPDRTARFELARGIAATALAQLGDGRAVEKLTALARADAAGSRVAADALVAYPPSGTTTAWARPMTPNALALAARTGDLRALEPALEASRSTESATRAAAIEALAALGDTRVLDAARAAANDPLPRLRDAGISALVTLGAPDAAPAVEHLLASDDALATAIPLAARVHSPGITRALVTRAGDAPDASLRAAAMVALGRDPSAEAVDALVARVADPLLGADAADALARSPSPRALSAIENLTAKLGHDASARRIATRAYVVRSLTRGEHSAPLDAQIDALAASQDGRDRALGALASALVEGRDARRLLVDHDPRVRRAAALVAVATAKDDEARDALLARFGSEGDAAARAALAGALVAGDPDGVVPTRTLFACARTESAAAPMCALGFTARATERDADAVDALLASSDPIVRAHAARGLGLSQEPTRAGRLAAAYAFEGDATVRRAVVAALARAPRDVPAVRDALDDATLDPDPAARALAARAREGRPPVDLTAGPRDVAWLHLVDASGDERARLGPPWTAYVVRPDGLAVPVPFEDEGDALVPDVPVGEARLVLAPRGDAAYSESP